MFASLLSASAPEPQNHEGAYGCQDVVHEGRGQQPQDDADVEPDGCPRDADQRGGDIAALGGTETGEPTAPVPVEAEARHDANDENDNEN